MNPNVTTTAAVETATDETEDHVTPAASEPTPAPAGATGATGATGAAAAAAAPAPALSEAATAVALVRAEAAEIAMIGAQALRLGLSIDVAEAVQKGLRPDAMRASVLNQLAARGDASAVAVVPPAKSATPESPLLAALKRAASAGKAA